VLAALVWIHPLAASPISTAPSAARCLALTMYWEAKGEGEAGMRAFGEVVLNRVGHPAFPDNICGVVQARTGSGLCQFSWYCASRDFEPAEIGPWRAALNLAAAMLKTPPSEATGGALFFHGRHLPNPWRRPRERTVVIGQHVYYK
jgi:spore germination cell wall hydrolase CwlJ-like protein